VNSFTGITNPVYFLEEPSQAGAEDPSLDTLLANTCLPEEAVLSLS
jgi:hypothetical protein